MSTADLKVFGGSAHPELTEEICRFLGLTPGALELQRFSDGELYIQILENVRGADVFVIQPTIPPAENTLQLLLMIDAFRRSSAARITVVVPYFGYARQERKDKPRVPISAKLMADLIEAAGADRVLTMDLHAPAIQGFFNVPVDHLFAAPVLIQHLQGHGLQDMVVVSPDAGGVERARFYSKKLGGSLAIIDKRRKGPNVAESIHVIGDVEGCDCVVVDDIIDTAGTLVKAVESLRERGAARVLAAAVHPVLSGPAVDRLERSFLDQVIATDTIPLRPNALACPKIRQLSVAELLGEAILRIHEAQSVSSLFV